MQSNAVLASRVALAFAASSALLLASILCNLLNYEPASLDSYAAGRRSAPNDFIARSQSPVHSELGMEDQNGALARRLADAVELGGSMAFTAEGVSSSGVQHAVRQALATLYGIRAESIAVRVVRYRFRQRLRRLGAYWEPTYTIISDSGSVQRLQKTAENVSHQSSMFAPELKRQLGALGANDVLEDSFQLRTFSPLIEIVEVIEDTPSSEEGTFSTRRLPPTPRPTEEGTLDEDLQPGRVHQMDSPAANPDQLVAAFDTDVSTTVQMPPKTPAKKTAALTEPSADDDYYIDLENLSTQTALPPSEETPAPANASSSEASTSRSESFESPAPPVGLFNVTLNGQDNAVLSDTLNDVGSMLMNANSTEVSDLMTGIADELGLNQTLKNVQTDVKKTNASFELAKDMADVGSMLNWMTNEDSSDEEGNSKAEAPKSMEQGCCFEIGFGPFKGPCCLRIEPNTKDACLAAGPPRHGAFGGARGWREECPSSAEEAHALISSDKKLAATAIEDLADIAQGLGFFKGSVPSDVNESRANVSKELTAELESDLNEADKFLIGFLEGVGHETNSSGHHPTGYFASVAHALHHPNATHRAKMQSQLDEIADLTKPEPANASNPSPMAVLANTSKPSPAGHFASVANALHHPNASHRERMQSKLDEIAELVKPSAHHGREEQPLAAKGKSAYGYFGNVAKALVHNSSDHQGAMTNKLDEMLDLLGPLLKKCASQSRCDACLAAKGCAWQGAQGCQEGCMVNDFECWTDACPETDRVENATAKHPFASVAESLGFGTKSTDDNPNAWLCTSVPSHNLSNATAKEQCEIGNHIKHGYEYTFDLHGKYTGPGSLCGPANCTCCRRKFASAKLVHKFKEVGHLLWGTKTEDNGELNTGFTGVAKALGFEGNSTATAADFKRENASEELAHKLVDVGALLSNVSHANSEDTTTMNASSDVVGCCFEFGYGPLLGPCCLRADFTTKAECVASGKPRHGHVGSDQGWRTNCPSSAEEAARWVAADKEAALMAVNAFADVANELGNEGNMTNASAKLAEELAGVGDLLWGAGTAGNATSNQTNVPGTTPHDGKSASIFEGVAKSLGFVGNSTSGSFEDNPHAWTCTLPPGANGTSKENCEIGNNNKNGYEYSFDYHGVYPGPAAFCGPENCLCCKRKFASVTLARKFAEVAALLESVHKKDENYESMKKRFANLAGVLASGEDPRQQKEAADLLNQLDQGMKLIGGKHKPGIGTEQPTSQSHFSSVAEGLGFFGNSSHKLIGTLAKTEELTGHKVEHLLWGQKGGGKNGTTGVYLGASVEEEGCCYRIGYGSMMVPCCLKTEAKSKNACLFADAPQNGVVGGGHGWRRKCPSSSDEAAAWIRQDQKDRQRHAMTTTALPSHEVTSTPLEVTFSTTAATQATVFTPLGGSLQSERVQLMGWLAFVAPGVSTIQVRSAVQIALEEALHVEPGDVQVHLTIQRRLFAEQRRLRQNWNPTYTASVRKESVAAVMSAASAIEDDPSAFAALLRQELLALGAPEVTLDSAFAVTNFGHLTRVSDLHASSSEQVDEDVDKIYHQVMASTKGHGQLKLFMTAGASLIFLMCCSFCLTSCCKRVRVTNSASGPQYQPVDDLGEITSAEAEPFVVCVCFGKTFSFC